MKSIGRRLTVALTLLLCLVPLSLSAASTGIQCMSCTYREAATQARNAAQKARQAGCAAAASCYEQFAKSLDCEAAKYGPNPPASCPTPSCDTSCSTAGGGGGNSAPAAGSGGAAPAPSNGVNVDAVRNARVIDNSDRNSANHGPAEVRDMSGGTDSALDNVLNGGRPIAINPGQDLKERVRKYDGDIRDAGALGLLFDDQKSHELFEKLFKKLGLDWDSVCVNARKPKANGRGNLGPDNDGGAAGGVTCGEVVCHRVIDFNNGTMQEFKCDPCNPPKVIEFPGPKQSPRTQKDNVKATWCGLPTCPSVPHDPQFFASLEDKFKAVARTYTQDEIARGKMQTFKVSVRDYADSYIAAVNRSFRDFVENHDNAPPPAQLLLHWDILQKQYESLINTLDNPRGKK